MLAPDAGDLRSGDFVKLRGTANPAHTGGKAVVVAVHRAPVSPWAVEAIDVRYSARGAAIRVELRSSGVLARWEAPWPQPATVERDERVVIGGTAGHDGARVPRRRLALTGLVLLVPAAAGVVWAQHSDDRPAPNPIVVQRNLAEAARAPSTASPGTAAGLPFTASASPAASAAAPTGKVVAYSTGPVPVVAEIGAAAPEPVALAGLDPAQGCHDDYAAEVFDLLPVGTPVTATAGWYRTADGLDVNEELVRLGVAVPRSTPAGVTAGEAARYAALRAAVPEDPVSCS